jgi:hypothetical protein
MYFTTVAAGAVPSAYVKVQEKKKKDKKCPWAPWNAPIFCP